MALLTRLSRALQGAYRASTVTRRQRPQPPRPRALLEEFEPRVLYSADTPLALLGDAVVRLAADPAPASVPAAAQASAAAQSTPAASTAAHEIAFVDTQVADYQRLVADLQRQADAGRPIEVHLIDAGQDGIQQITDTLQGRHDLTAVHIFSHGIDGAVELGGAWLNAYSLEVCADEVAQWKAALAPGADLLLYGCDVAADADGQAFIGRLAELTGADVAASRDATGSAALGGNWNLEYATGAIKTDVAIDTAGQAQYDGLLAIVAGNTSSGLSASGNTLTFTHDVPVGANGILIVNVSYQGGNSNSVASVSYGGVALTQLGSASNRSGANETTEMWYLKAPAAGSANVAITMNAGTIITGGASSFLGVDQATPTSAFATNTGRNYTPTVTISSASGELVIDSLGERATSAGTVNAGQTEKYHVSSGSTGGDTWGSSSTQPGAASVTMGWTTSGTGTGEYAIAAASLTPATNNNAPTLTNGATVTLASTNEDTPSSGTTVDSVLASAGWADVDTGAAKGIAVTSASGNGAWQYSTDGTTWTGFGAVSSTNALLLAAGTQVRYQPDTFNGETAAFAFKAWDQTSGSASTNATPAYASTATSGGTTAFSTQNASASMTVTSVNDAPTLTNGATVALASTNEDTPSSGTTVASVLTSAGWADVDTGAAKGIAVTSASGNGAWQYSTDGTTWTGFGAVSSTNALLLAAGTQVRYQPDTFNGETAAFAFKAWDQTSGSASTNATPAYASTATSGGTTAFSTQNASASMTVTSVNDAPTLTNGATVALASTNEDTPSSGTTVASVLTSAGWADVDTGAAKGIAVTSASGNGTWQYSTDGTTWTGFGAVSSTNALLLAAGTQVRYQPDTFNGETATFAFKAWDQTSGAASINGTPGYASTAASGGTTAYSSQNASASMTVTSVNDAPTLTNGATVALASTNEDTPSSGTTVTSVLTSAGWADVDTGAAKGIAVTSASGNGTWQYSTDGTTWTGFGAVSSTNALLLAAGTQVRYQPDTLNGETATFAFKAWDQTSGAASINATPAYASTAASGGTAAFSTQNASASMTVTSVNDAPTLTNGATVALASTNEDTPSSGTTVDSVLASAGWADVDTGAAKGIAVTSASGNGTWQYSTDGTTWTGFGAVSSTNALLLAAGTQVRYQPDTFNGETATFAFKAWDQTSGAASINGTPAYASTAASGGTAAFSTQNASASMTVTSVNDAPTLTNGATVALASTNEDTPSSGTTVDSVLASAGWADVDTGAAKGIAVTSASGNGTWQYSTDGTAWTGFGAVSSTNALLLAAGTQVRYQPDTFNGETATFAFKAWDQTSGAASINATPAYASTAASGGTAAYSSQNASASMTVTSVNDAPTIVNGTTVTLAGTNEDTPSSGTTVTSVLTSAGWADVDTGAVKGIAVTSASGNGAWQYSTDGTTWTGFGAVSSTNALLLAAGTQVRYQPDTFNGETATFAFKAWDQTSGAASINGTPGYASTAASGGTTAYSSQNASASMTVTSVNDAPTLTNGATVALASTNEDTPSSGTTVDSVLASVGWADVDTGALKGIAVTSASGNGAWQYSTDGTTWTGFGAVSSTNALLLAAGTQVRYQPDTFNGETATFAFKAWDQTSGAASINGTPAYASTAASGGTTAYSSQNASASMTVTSVNDAPTLTNGATVALASTNEDTPSSGTTVDSVLASVGWADVDTGALKGIAVTSASGNGTWQYSTDGTTWTGFGAVSSTNALLLAAGTQVRYQPDTFNGETATFAFKAWDQTSGAASINGTPGYASTAASGGTAAYSSQSSTTTLVVTNVNDAPTGAPVITGTATERQTLTADTSSIADVDGLGTFAYQWLRDGSAVTGATTNTYLLGNADVAARMSVQVSYTDGHGTPESLTSAPTAAVANVNDAPTGAPAVTGTATERQTLTADTSSIADADGLGPFAYQWLRSGSAIAGATAGTYVPGNADVGAPLSVRVSYTDGHGTAESLTSAPTAAVANVNDAPTGAPVVTGIATERQTLTADTSSIADADGLGRFGWQWLRDGRAVAGATGSSYLLGNADVDARISVQVTYTDGHGTVESLTSASTAPVVNVDDAPTGVPVIVGTAAKYQPLTVDTSAIADADGLGAFAYQWYRDGRAVAGATAPTYVPGNADLDARISVQVSYTDGHGTAESLASAPTAPVAFVDAVPVVAVNRPLTLDEGGSARIDASLLQATDDDDAPDQLTYTVDAPPSAGRLESTGAPGVVLTRFTQADVDAGRLRYVHDGSETSADRFGFVLADGHGAVLASVNFRIAVTAQNDAPVLASTSGAALVVASGAAPQPVDRSFTAADVDSPLLTQAVVRIDSRYLQGFDQLTLAGTHPLTAVWNAADGSLTLSGSASPATYAEALRSVQFATSSPLSGGRQLSFVVSDSAAASVPVMKSVVVLGAGMPTGAVPAMPSTTSLLPQTAATAASATASASTSPAAPVGMPTARTALSPASEDADGADAQETVASSRNRAARLALATPGQRSSGHGGAGDSGGGDAPGAGRSALERFQLDLVAYRLAPDAGDAEPADEGIRPDLRQEPKYGDAVRGQGVESRNDYTPKARAADLSELIGERSTPDTQNDSDLVFDVLAEPGVSGGLIVSASVLWWATRAGGLLAAMMASVPAWRSFDPLPILARTRPSRRTDMAAAGLGGDFASDDDGGTAPAAARPAALALPAEMPAVFRS